MTEYQFSILKSGDKVSWKPSWGKKSQAREVMTNSFEGTTRVICLAPTMANGSQKVSNSLELKLTKV